MGQIADYVKDNFTPAEGITISEVEKLEKDLNPLSGLSTTDQFLDFMGRNEGFKNALKKHETQAIEKHDTKFKTDKLPGLLKEHGDKIRLEANPKETDDQKEIRELKEWKLDSERSGKEKDLRIELKDKAKEVGYTGDIELFMHLDDKAIETMTAFHETNTKYLEAEKEKLVKEVYGKNTPPNKSEIETPKDIDEQIRTARSEGKFDLALKLQMQKNTKPQQ